MNFMGPVINSAEQADNLCRILSDDEIRLIVEREISSVKHPLKSMVLTWEKVQREYLLEIILTEEVAEGSATPEARCITIGCIGECEYNAPNRLLMAGRRVYFRLRKDFPMLRRRLSISRYIRAKMR